LENIIECVSRRSQLLVTNWDHFCLMCREFIIEPCPFDLPRLPLATGHEAVNQMWEICSARHDVGRSIYGAEQSVRS
jgi:hypothetical protein